MYFFTAYYVAYPIVWILGGKGVGLYGTSWETLLFALLDITAKVIYAYVLLKDKEVFGHHSGSKHAKYAPNAPAAGAVAPQGSTSYR